MERWPASADTRRTLSRIEDELRRIDRAAQLADWRIALGRARATANPWPARRRELLAGPVLAAALRAGKRSGRGTLLGRRAELLERSVLEVSIEQSDAVIAPRLRLQAAAADFRPRWRGRRVGREVVWRALRTDPSRAVRRRAYYAEDALYRRLEPGLLDLVERRNAAARAAGFRSFPEWRLATDGLTVAGLEELLDVSLRHARSEMRRWRDLFRDRTGEGGWAPWDLEYAQQLEAGLPDRAFPARTMVSDVLRAIGQWGFPRSALRFRIDRHDLPSGGLCVTPDPPRDVRTIIHPSGGFWPYFALFHESGHAVAARTVRQPTHLLQDPERTPGFGGFLEAEGGLFERIPWSEPWLRARPGISGAQARSTSAQAVRGALFAIGALAVWTRQELTTYLHPGRDPAAEGERLARRIFGYDAYRPRSFADSFAIELPLYGVAYVLAELIQAQWREAISADLGGPLWPNRRVGPWLVERLFRHGARTDWRHRVRAATGRRFGPGAFDREMRRATSV